METRIKNSSLAKEERSLIRTFTYHTSRIFVSEALQKSHPTQKDLSALDLNKLTDDKFISSVDLLKDTITEFKNTSSTTTSSSISKSGPFEEFLTKKLIERYKQINSGFVAN